MTSQPTPMMRRLLSTAMVVAIATPVLAQNRADFRWEKALPAGNEVSIHNVNGDVTVKPSTSGKVEVTGTKRGNSLYFDEIKAQVRETSSGVVVCVQHADDDSECGDSGRRHGNYDWRDVQMDLEVAVPTNLRVSAASVSGDVTVTGAHGDVDVNSVSGDVRLDGLHATSIHANSVSGDIDVGVSELTGRGDLYFHTVSGDVTLEVPRGFDADLSMSTVSGDIDSDFPITLGNGRMSRRRIEARIGNGGRRLDVATVSGDLRVRMAK
ncbi:MAG TPA: DUF4097 family beta strand repeat-containing protein [Gemmatimonadaceae bacterium]|nr:DUF4097 family beta strand repeat-containing protein [Gemmatimonadaceae bacterium]